MTQAQAEAERCGLIPEEVSAEFYAQHLSAYAFVGPRVAGQKVLEVGFGDGYGAAYLARTAREVAAVDVVEGNIPLARKKYPLPNLAFHHFDGLHLPFPDGAFDAAGSFQVIEHVPEPHLVQWLAEIRRVLHLGGRFYVSTLNLEHAQKPGKPYQKLIYHEKEFTKADLQDLLQQIFPRVQMYGLHPSPKHRLFKRLKKWGFRGWLPGPLNVVDRFYARMTPADFVVRAAGVPRSLDLIAVCETAWPPSDQRLTAPPKG